MGVGWWWWWWWWCAPVVAHVIPDGLSPRKGLQVNPIGGISACTPHQLLHLGPQVEHPLEKPPVQHPHETRVCEKGE